MSKIPYMPFFVGDYLSDTPHLSLESHGAYCLILFYTWKTKKWIVDDDKKMKRILRVHGTKWKRIREEIEPYFDLSTGVWFNKKVEEAFMRNGYKIDQKSLEKTDKIVIKNAQKNSNELKINKTDKNEEGYTNLIQSKDNKRSKKVSSSTKVTSLISNSVKGTNLQYQNVVEGRSLRKDHPDRKRQIEVNNMSRQDLKEYWLQEIG